jgi:hypothetical protein
MKENRIIDVADLRAASELLDSYRKAREGFHTRVREEENWYRMRISPKKHMSAEGEAFAPTSGWLFNALMQKHADLMENVPSAVCLPREPGDEKDAEALSSILPVILERCDFVDGYAENMWHKLKHGICAWGVFFDPTLENGLGDICVKPVDMAQLYWQPDVQSIQDSEAVFALENMSESELRLRYPAYDGKSSKGDEVVVVDWYYKKRTPEGRTLLHYCKFIGETVLFSSENEEGYENGWYEHGQYPFVTDVLYPIAGTGLGFGVIALGKDAQTYIDRMDRNLLEYMDWATRVRYFCKRNTGVDEEAFLDLSRRIVDVEGDPDEERLRQITVAELDSFWLSLKEHKIRELKETTANRDVLQGAPESGVTAAAAIAALQEAGNKSMRDIITTSHRAFVRVVRLVVECIRQFYDESRCFRILGDDGYRYLHWSNKDIKEQQIGTMGDGTPLSRRPIFDIDVRAEKQDPYTRYSYNETLKELYSMGVFEPENAAAAKMLLDAMDFPGVGRLRTKLASVLRSRQSDAANAPHKAEKPYEGHGDPLERAHREAYANRAQAAGEALL